MLLFLVIASLLLISSVSAAESAPSLLPAVNSSPSKMQVAVFINSIYNLDMVQGTYSIDSYLTFRWTDPSIETANFEFMNGEPSSSANSVEKIYEDKSGPVKEEWYRVRADFRVTPNNMDYPYESGILPIEIENANLQSSQLIYVPLTEESGMEPGFVIPGWKFGTPTFSVTDHSYPGNQTFSQISYNIPITNDALASLLQTIVPPLIFCIIAALSFLIRVDHPELVHLRYVLTTSMFISAVMYHFGQLALIPGLGVLKLFDKFMIAVYLFLAVTVTVTTLCYLAQQQWGRPELVKPINRYGVVVSILLPVVSFWLLLVLI
ncbi:hypothetical protein [Methanoregula sp.]|jgi:hypothetical protein|uniref:hypothetical protein n=1 Tax=Methanoregula sp. TaxID=2052170 RepID=UPI003C778696